MTNNNDFSIAVAANGPYLVAGGLALHRRRDVQSELGEPMTWSTTSTLQTKDRYALCRCGQSGAKPFCDGTHARIGFEADDVCVHAGFCGTKATNVWDEAAKVGDTAARMHAIAMIEHCPSGALTYQFDGVVNEPLLPQAVGVISDGPLWV
jgi:CDGSH-type Zn-finger protein